MGVTPSQSSPDVTAAGVNKPNMDPIKRATTNTIDYDESEFVSSTQEGGDPKKMPYEHG